MYMLAMLCSRGSILGSYAYLGKVLYNACSVAVLSARMLQAMLCSNGSRKLIFFSLQHLLGLGLLFWCGSLFLFLISFGVSLLGKRSRFLSSAFLVLKLVHLFLGIRNWWSDSMIFLSTLECVCVCRLCRSVQGDCVHIPIAAFRTNACRMRRGRNMRFRIRLWSCWARMLTTTSCCLSFSLPGKTLDYSIWKRRLGDFQFAYQFCPLFLGSPPMALFLSLCFSFWPRAWPNTTRTH